MPSDFLTAEEQEEYQKQVSFLGSVHFHEWAKCGERLIPYTYPGKRHTVYRRQFCTVHKVVVNLSGWKLGWSEAGKLSDLNKK